MKKILFLLLISVLFKSQVSETEKSALINLYNVTGGKDWAISWNLSQNPKNWYGITISDGSVTEIKLNSNNLKGNLPSFSAFQNLKVLYLNDNNLSGSAANFPTSLEEFDVANNRLEGDISVTVSGLSNLKILNLGGNRFTAADFSFLQNLTALKSLGLSGIGLKKIPAQLGKLISLELLDISATHPKEGFSALAGLQALTELNLANDSLVAVPAEISSLKNLKTLNLADNGVKNFTPLSALNNIEWLSLENNGLSAVPQEISGFAKLFQLNLSANTISDFGALTKLSALQQLFLNSNSLTQISGEVLGLKNLQMLSLIGNELSGDIPQNLPTVTFIQNNHYSLKELQSFLSAKSTFNTLEYSPQRYDASLTVQAEKGSRAALKQSLAAADGYTFSWFKNLDEDIRQTGESLVFSSVQKEDYAKYTAEAYYFKPNGDDIIEASFFREPVTLAEGNLGTQEVNAGLYIYPNPVSDYLNIHADHLKIEKSALYDIAGRLLLTVGGTRIGVGTLPSGSYLIVIKTSEGQKTFKFIKE